MALHKNLTGEDAVHPFAIIAAADPGAIGAGKAWLNTATTPHQLTYRNAANTGWEDIQGSAGASQEELDALTGRVETLETEGASHVALAVQFGDGATADAAGAVRIVRVPVGLTPIGWMADADSACTATFTVEKSAAGAASWSSLVGSGTSPALTAATHAADTDGAVDWSGGSVAQYGALLVTLATYTAGASKRVGLTILFARA